MGRFEAFLRKQPSLRVVLSTSWRLDLPWDELLALFSSDVRDRFLGLTPDLEAQGGAALREREIDAWRTEHLRLQLPWVALADDASGFRPGCPRLVVCETIKGLRPIQLAKIEELLGLEQGPSSSSPDGSQRPH